MVEREDFALIVVQHPDAAVVGERTRIPDGDLLELGRHSHCFGAGALDVPRLSRNHATVSRDGSAFRLTDRASRNGTYVNGARIEEAEVHEGDLIGLGEVGVMLHRGPVDYQPPRHPKLLGVSFATLRLLEAIAQVAEADSTVLIGGETGVGKDVVARCVHDASGRSGAFVALNCGGLAEGVVQSELFGHAAGAFSGATATRGGLVNEAAGGTLFLDEVGECSPQLQTSLLRLIEQREFRAVGSDRLETTDARFIAATHLDLEKAVSEGRFRADLYNRLNVWRLHVPPLRSRREDILPLARAFADRERGETTLFNQKLPIALLRYRWPGNVRELQSVMVQAARSSLGKERVRLPRELRERLKAADEVSAATPVQPLEASPRRPPNDELRARLRAVHGNVKLLAEQLHVSRNTMYRWLRKADIEPDQMR